MNPITYRITLDLMKTGCQHVLSGIKVGDSVRKLEIRLTEGGVPYSISEDSYAQIRFNRPDGTIFTDLCRKEGNVIKYTIDPAVLSSKGEYEADIQLGNADGESFASAEFLFLAYEAVVDDSKAPEDVYHSLIQAIADAESNMVKDAKVDADGNLIVSLDGGKEINAGNVMGPQGPEGPAGPEGKKGDKGDSAPPDYNLVANALKGSAEGNPIRLDGVSPLEHEIAVGLKSKNILPYPYASRGGTVLGVTYTVSDDGGISMSGSPTGASECLLYNGEILSKEGSLVFSFSGTFTNAMPQVTIIDANNTQLFYKQTTEPIIVNMDQYPTAARLYFFIKRVNNGAESSGTVYPQIERGTIATPYTPYMDFTKDYMVGGVVTDTNFSFTSGTVYYTEDTFVQVTKVDTSNNGTLTFSNGDIWIGSGQLTSSIDGNLGEAFSVGDWACISPNKSDDVGILDLHKATKVDKTVQRSGKNLLSYPFIETTKTTNGITFTDNGDGTITVNGTATADAVFKCSYFTLDNNYHTISGCPAGGSSSTYYFHFRGFDVDSGSGRTFKSNSTFKNNTEIVIKSGTKANNLVFKPQMERGSTATEFEPYVEPTTYTAENGNVAVPSLAPTTVLMAGNGVVASAEYNKDTNKVIESLVNAIISLGGNV